MPGRTAAKARDAFLAPLRRCLSCVTDAQLIVSGGKRVGDSAALTISKEPLRLRSASLGSVELILRQRFQVVRDTPARFHVSTESYFYRLNNAAGRELASWHWHPEQRVSYPHVHVACDTLTSAAHLPTGRVSVEAVLRLLLNDLGVTARRADYTEVLDTAELPFIQHRRWHALGPGAER